MLTIDRPSRWVISIFSSDEHDFQLNFVVILSFDFPKDLNNLELDQVNYCKKQSIDINKRKKKDIRT